MACEYVPYQGPIVDRQTAREMGLLRYFDGKPCKYGHISQRSTRKNNVCLKCHSERRKRLYRQDNTTDKEYRKKNRAKYRDWDSAWREKNREKVNELSRIWTNNNKHKKKASDRLNKSSRKNAEGYFDGDDVLALKIAQNNKCANCHTDVSVEYEVDHILPIKRGGTNWPNNLQILCPKCNRRKQAQHPAVWDWKNGRRFCDYFKKLSTPRG